MRVSLSNLGATATWTTDSPDSAYPASNLQRADKPFMPAKTAAVGTKYFQADFGGAKQPPWLIINRASFTSLLIQGDDDVAFGSPNFTSGALTVDFNRMTGRYTQAYDLTNFNNRYLRLTMSGSPVSDIPGRAAVSSAFSLGGVWIADPASALVDAYTVYEPPKFGEWWRHRVHHPRVIKRPEHEGWARHRIAGNTWVTLTYPHRVQLSRSTPFQGDDAGAFAYRDLVAAWLGPFALWEDPLNNGAGNNNLAWIVRDAGLDDREWEPSSEFPEVMSREWTVDECI